VDLSVVTRGAERQLRRDRAELEAFRVLGLDCLEHAPERKVMFASMAARLEARRQFGEAFLRACRRRFPELSCPVDEAAQKPMTRDDLIECEWRLRSEQPAAA
jgi:hypothetical protein